MTLYPSNGCSMLTTRVRVLRAKTGYLRDGEGGGNESNSLWRGRAFLPMSYSVCVLMAIDAWGRGEKMTSSAMSIWFKERTVSQGEGGLF